MRAVLRWIAGVIAIIVGLSALMFSFIGGLLMIIGGVFLLPPTINWINSRYQSQRKQPMSTLMKGLLTIGIFGIGFMVMINSISKNRESDNVIVSKNSVSDEDMKKAADTFYNKIYETAMIHMDFLERFDPVQYSLAVRDNNSVLDSFENVASSVLQLRQYEADSFISLSKKLKGKLRSVKVQHMPTLRKQWAKLVGDAVWEDDMYVSVSGKSNTVLTLTSALFAANKHIKEHHKTLDSDEHQKNTIAKKYGFKQIRYAWYKGQDDFTYFDIASQPDDFLENEDTK